VVRTLSRDTASIPIGGCAPDCMRVQNRVPPTFDPREEPGALAAHAGSVRGARSNDRQRYDRAYRPSKEERRLCDLLPLPERPGGQFKELYPDTFRYEGKRAIVFELNDKPSKRALAHCIGLALTHHLRKK